jgi:hypothetical protein
MRAPLATLWALAAAKCAANPNLMPAAPSYVQLAEWEDSCDG